MALGLRHWKVIPRLHETQSLKARQEEVSRRDNEAAVGMSRQETPTLWPALGSRVNTQRGKGTISSPESLEVNTTRRSTEVRRKIEQEVVSVGGRIKGSVLCFTDYMLIGFCFVLGGCGEDTQLRGNQNPGEAR